MAYVAISQILLSDVRQTIINKRHTEINLLTKPSQDITIPQDEWLTRKLWGEHIGLINLTPHSWKRHADTLRIHYKYINSASLGASLMLDLHSAQGNYELPPRSDSSWIEVTDAELVGADPLLTERIVQLKAYKEEHDEIEARWTKVRNDVASFLEHCKSLNEALKLWPDIRIYIPQRYLDKAETVTKKAKAAESTALEHLKSIDTDNAVASAVMLRMRESSTVETNHEF
jgi:hypothetical protein